MPDNEIEAILGALGFAPRRREASPAPGSPLAVWECQQPSWREDVTSEIDLIEEVARHHGLDKFPPRLPASRQPAARLPHAEAEDRLRERLIALGVYPFVVPFVPISGTPLESHPAPTPAFMHEILGPLARLVRAGGLSASEIKAGCGKCGACSALSTYEREASA